ncbi:MAG: Wzz/FepE/Etk N-terminal domain-containing protein [Candidatus Hydrogenedentes bacterium]|nr:Wzz/FepE/Etk N-terminal domain-containing protein [Candidatus Hydrogenedentota bacterium]
MNELTRACLKALYEKRWVLLLVAVVALVFSVVRLVFFTPGSYYAEVVLVASTPKQGSEVKDLMPEVYNPKIYVELVSSRTVLYETYQTVLESNVFPEDELPEFDDFASWLRASVRVVDQTTRPINYSPLITLWVWDVVPERARTVVDIWAEKAMKAAQTANLMQYGELSTVLKKQADLRKENLDKLWQALEKEKAQFDVTSKKEELRLLFKEMDELLHAQAVSERMAAAAEAQLAAIEQKLVGEKPLIELFRSPSDDAYWLLESNAQKEKKTSVEGKGMVTQQLNEVYWRLRADENRAAADLAGAQAEILKIKAQMDSVTERQNDLMAEVAQHEYAQQRLTVEEELATAIYKNVSTAQTILSETASVVHGMEDQTVYPVGLNRLSNLSPVKDDLAMKSKLIVLSYTFLAVVLAMGAVTAPIIGGRLLEQINK